MRSADPGDGHGSEDNAAAANGGFSHPWQPKKLGFFDSNHDDKLSIKFSALKNTSKGTIYRDIYIFINCTKNYISIHKAKMIRINLFHCIKECALK